MEPSNPKFGNPWKLGEVIKCSVSGGRGYPIGGGNFLGGGWHSSGNYGTGKGNPVIGGIIPVKWGSYFNV